MPWLWVRPCDQAATSVSSWGRHGATTGTGSWFMAERGSASCASPRRLLEEFLILGSRALFALENWCIVPLLPCIWQPFLGVWVLHVELKIGFFGRWIWCLRQYLALDALHNFSTLPWTRILKSLVFVLTQNGEECSVDASVSVCVALFAPGNLEFLSRVPRGWR